ncbi:MAG: enoyl-CoA hydratase/isomerase family protein [Dehalococcoidia bacterium]
MTDAPVLYEKTGDGIAWVTLNRPQALNAINLRMRDDLWEIMHAVRDDPHVRVVIFKGAGDRAFSAGADVTEFGTAPSIAEARRARQERDLWRFMLTLEKGLVAAIHGFALGAGIELPMCCDIRIVSEDAKIGLPEVSLGYIPSAGGTQTLPRLVPRSAAMQIILSGQPIDANTALQYGLVHDVVPRDQLDAEAERVARRIAAQPPHVVALVKRAVLAADELSAEGAMAVESNLARRALAARFN